MYGFTGNMRNRISPHTQASPEDGGAESLRSSRRLALGAQARFESSFPDACVRAGDVKPKLL